MSLIKTLQSYINWRVTVHDDIIGTIYSIPGFFAALRDTAPVHDGDCVMVDGLEFTEQVGN